MYLGVDIGTSGVKASLVDAGGKVRASAYRRFTLRGLEQNRRELDPAEMTEGVVGAIRETVESGGGVPVELVMVSSLGEAVIPADRAGVPLTNCIVGSDGRGAEELEEVRGRVGAERLTEITGLNLSVIYTLNKVLHLRRHRPDVYRKAWKFFCVQDFFVHFLTGEACIDYSMASRTLAFDIGEKCWSEEILEAAGVDSALFSRAVLGGTVVGEIGAAVAGRVGLAPGTRVAVGAHDHICNAIGSGAVRAGDCSNAVGTTEGITAILAGRLDSRTVSAANISCEPFVVSGMYNTVAWHNTAGALVNWYLGVFHGESGGGVEALEGCCGEGPSGLMVLPHFSGATAGVMDSGAKGAIIGLTLGSTRGDVLRALMEGACYECRVILDALSGAGIAVGKLFVSGGGSRSGFWVQAKADILDRPLLVADGGDTGVLGAAVLSATVCGRYGDLAEAAGAMLGCARVVEPIPANVRRYAERYAEYCELYEKLRPVNRLL